MKCILRSVAEWSSSAARRAVASAASRNQRLRTPPARAGSEALQGMDVGEHERMPEQRGAEDARQRERVARLIGVVDADDDRRIGVHRVQIATFPHRGHALHGARPRGASAISTPVTRETLHGATPAAAASPALAGTSITGHRAVCTRPEDTDPRKLGPDRSAASCSGRDQAGTVGPPGRFCEPPRRHSLPRAATQRSSLPEPIRERRRVVHRAAGVVGAVVPHQHRPRARRVAVCGRDGHDWTGGVRRQAPRRRCPPACAGSRRVRPYRTPAATARRRAAVSWRVGTTQTVSRHPVLGVFAKKRARPATPQRVPRMRARVRSSISDAQPPRARPGRRGLRPGVGRPGRQPKDVDHLERRVQRAGEPGPPLRRHGGRVPTLRRRR